MDDIRVDTAQNVAVDYEIASVWDRVAAVLVDIIIKVIFFIVGMIIMSNIVSGENMRMVILALIILPILFYHFICETTMNGQSIGKKVMLIKVIKKDGTQPTIGSYLLRWILRLIEVDMLGGSLALAAIIINGKGQRLGDIAAGTTVVKINNNKSLKRTILTDLNADYSPSFKEVAQLSESDIRIIKEVLDQKNKGYDWIVYVRMLRKTCDAITAKMGVEKQDDPAVFLETVIKDYNALNINV